MSKEFLPKGVKEIYYQANPIIIFRRDKINIKKLERIFVEFQEIRDHKNEESQNRTDDDDSLSKILDFENPLAYLDDFIEKHKTERFIQENANLRYFVICNITKVQVGKDEHKMIINKSNELNDHTDSAVDIPEIRNGINDKNSENYLSNYIDSGWESLDDNSYYNRDIEMDEQSQEFWDSL